MKEGKVAGGGAVKYANSVISTTRPQLEQCSWGPQGTMSLTNTLEARYGG